MDFDFGLLYSFRNPPRWHMDWKRVYDETIEHIVAMEDAGFDTIWLTEHHFSEDGYLPSLAVMSAAIAMRTTRVTVGHSIIELPLHHPVALAEDIAVADILSGGRIRMGVGLGRMNDWRPSFAHEGMVFGAPLNARDRAPIFQEQIEILKLCWGDGPFEYDGTYFQFPEINVMPKPLQPGGPKIYFGVGDQAKKALDRAARMGHGWTGDKGGLENYLGKVKENGREAEASNAVIFVNHVPAEDPEAMEAKYGEHLAYILQWYAPDGPPIPGPEGGWFAEPSVVAAELDEARERGATGALWFAPIAGISPIDAIPIYASIINDVKPLMAENVAAATAS